MSRRNKKVVQQVHIQGDLFRNSYKNPKVYSPQQIEEVIENYIKNEPKCKTKKSEYYNIPCSFDIETTSFQTSYGSDMATMYVWQMCLNGAIIYGRTWREFDYVCEKLTYELELTLSKRLLFYVHNLSFEMNWIRKRFIWGEMFATEERKPLKATTIGGLEFRCSYRLSGYNLEKTCDNLLKYKVEKKVGDLDYRLYRHFDTPLTETELGYCFADVIGVCCYIQEEIERNGGKITKIPLTMTGYARNLCKEYCFGKTPKERQAYTKFMRSMTIEMWEYDWLKKAFQGGFTHASALKNVKEIINDVTSWDYTSSYPTVLVAEMYPVGKGEKVYVSNIEELETLNKKYLTVFPIILENVESKVEFDHIISASKCFILEDATIDNGRVVKASKLGIYITNVDWEVYKMYYNFDEPQVNEVLKYRKGYLPTNFIKAIAYLYKAKTELKDVAGKEEEYQHAKALLNSLYGMLCTSITREEIEYEDDWLTLDGDAEEQLHMYNVNGNRFSHFSWGVFCTSYARRNLLLSIYNVGNDYCYADTDSMKIENSDDHIDFINWYNEWITNKINIACDYHHIPQSDFCPKTIKGKEKPLGVFDFDGHYKIFSVMGAKRYMAYYDNNELSLTVAGVNKFTTLPYLLNKHKVEFKLDEKTNLPIILNEDNLEFVFEEFNECMIIPKEHSGKLVSKYIDYEICEEITDYLGETRVIEERSGVWLGSSEYNMKLSPEYENFLNDIISEVIKDV